MGIKDFFFRTKPKQDDAPSAVDLMPAEPPPPPEEVAAPAPSPVVEAQRRQAKEAKEAYELALALAELCRQAEDLAASDRWLVADELFAQLAERWAALAAPGKAPELEERFARARALYEENRQTKENRNRKVKDRERCCVELEALVGRYDDEATTAAEGLLQRWEGLEPAPPEYMEILSKRFDKAVKAFKEEGAKAKQEKESRVALLARLETLCQKAELLSRLDDWERSDPEVKKISAEWKELTIGTPGVEEFHARFQAFVEEYRRRKAEHVKTTRERALQELDTLTGLCGELETLKASPDLAAVLPRVKEIQTVWENANALSSLEKADLKSRFQGASQEFFDKLRLLRQEADWARWENYTLKLDLCAKTEALATDIDLFNVSKKLKEYRDSWKEIGHVPREKSDEVWERFNTAWNAARAVCDGFFDGLRLERERNLELKTALIQEAETLQDSEDWKNTAERLKALQEEWNKIGQPPRETGKELHERFRSACNRFFERRAAQYAIRQATQEEHQKAKEAFCAEAEALPSLGWREGLDKLKELRLKWRETGSARREVERELWDRFTRSCDAFDAKLKTEEPLNLQAKEALVQEAEAIAQSLDGEVNFNDLALKVKDLNLRWKELGPVAPEHTAELWERFNRPIKTFFDKRHERFESMKEQWRANLELKESLIAKIEAIAAANSNWMEATEEVKKIQEEWKAVGNVEKSRGQELWDRYHAACDAFFNQKQDFFEQLNAQRLENLKEKSKLCARLEQLAGGATDPSLTTAAAGVLAEELLASITNNFADAHHKLSDQEAMAEVREIQDRWRCFGPAPRAEEDKLYARFQRAKDQFYKNRKPGRQGN